MAWTQLKIIFPPHWQTAVTGRTFVEVYDWIWWVVFKDGWQLQRKNFFVLCLSFTCRQTWWQELQQLFWILSGNEDGGQMLNMVKKKDRRSLNFWWGISWHYHLSSRLSPVDFFSKRKIKLYLVQAVSTKHTILLIKLGVWELAQ